MPFCWRKSILPIPLPAATQMPHEMLFLPFHHWNRSLGSTLLSPDIQQGESDSQLWNIFDHSEWAGLSLDRSSLVQNDLLSSQLIWVFCLCFRCCIPEEESVWCASWRGAIIKNLDRKLSSYRIITLAIISLNNCKG